MGWSNWHRGAWAMGRVALLLTGVGVLGGCGVARAEASFADDFQCDSAQATASDAKHRYVVTGCGKRATYICINACSLQVVDETSSDAESDETKTRPPPVATVASEVRLENKGDEQVMLLELVLEGKALLRLTAVPDKHSDVVQLKLVRAERDQTVDACKMDWMLNGQVMATPPAVVSRTGDVLSHRVQFGSELIAELGTASQVALRICRTRYGLTGEQLTKVHEFVARFHEGMAWNDKPRAGGTGGMVAPAGGWPAWAAVASKPPAKVEGPALDGREVFKKLSPSILVLVAARAQGSAQGSAVAISATELLTNCHVLQGALKITLKQNKQEWRATLVHADPASDRCTVRVPEAKFRPVAGARPYDSLEVGEAAYTLGSPVGLELTLGSGIISGRRDEEGRPYVQTTAPISPGSSGGGLFDSHGNLIGVTTLVLAGRERLNQSLNFAIPAEAFYQP